MLRIDGLIDLLEEVFMLDVTLRILQKIKKNK